MEFDVAKTRLEQRFADFLSSPTEEAFRKIYDAALRYGPAFASAQRKGIIISNEAKPVISSPTCDHCRLPQKSNI